MHFALLKTTKECANVNQVILAIPRSAVKLLISVKAHLVQLVQRVATIVDHSSVYANRDSSEIPTIMVVKSLKNVKSITTVLRQPSVYLKMERTSVKMFAKMSNVASTLIALLKIMQHSANVDLVSKAIPKIAQTVVNRNLHHVL